MAPNLLTVRLDCSGLQHKRFVHFVRLSSSRDLGGRDFAIIWAKFSARIRKTPAHNPKMELHQAQEKIAIRQGYFIFYLQICPFYLCELWYKSSDDASYGSWVALGRTGRRRR